VRKKLRSRNSPARRRFPAPAAYSSEKCNAASGVAPLAERGTSYLSVLAHDKLHAKASHIHLRRGGELSPGHPGDKLEGSGAPWMARKPWRPAGSHLAPCSRSAQRGAGWLRIRGARHHLIRSGANFPPRSGSHERELLEQAGGHPTRPRGIATRAACSRPCSVRTVAGGTEWRWTRDG